MAGSSYHAVMVALTQKVTGLTYPSLIGTDEAVQFLDSPSAGGYAAENVVFLGLDPQGDEGARGTQKYAGLGGFVKYEDFEVLCAISCFVGGSTNTDGTLLDASDAQNSARSNAYGILNTIEQALISDLQLLGVANPPVNAVGGSPIIKWLDVNTLGYLPSEVNEKGATVGRQADVAFSVGVHARIVFTPAS